MSSDVQREDAVTDCSCDWTTVADVRLTVPVMAWRNPACAQHGDGTDWLARVRDHARHLGGHLGRQLHERDQ